MNLVKKILNKLNGLYYTHEYLCFAKGSLTQPLHVYLVREKHVVKDITNHHLFTGYSPLIFAFPDLELPGSLHLIFSQAVFHPNEIFTKKDALASLYLEEIQQRADSDCKVVYYEGVGGVHHFLNGFHQFINNLNNEWFNKRPGNVFLHNNLYKQVQIAYAIPRNISLITIAQNDLFNLFPTDLHGQIDKDHYVISLRVGGKAGEQVESAGRVLISRVHCDLYKEVYALGKNHMHELKRATNFPFSGSSSSTFGWPLPQQAIVYTELSLVDSFVQGIHKIFLFRIVFQQTLQAETDTLAHIHNSYATWRHNNGLQGNYLLV